MIDLIVHQAGPFSVRREEFKGRVVYRVYRDGVTAASRLATFDLRDTAEALRRARAHCDALQSKRKT